jgi:hypothetical protein
VPAPLTRNITFTKGDDYEHVLTFDDSVDRTDYTYRAMVRADAADTGTAEASFTCVLDDESNTVTMTLTDSDTGALAAGKYTWDVEQTDADSKVTTLLKGTVTVVQDVSH